MGKILNKLTKLPVFLIKAIYVLPFFLFGLWLIQMLYFPQFDTKKIIEITHHKSKDKNIFRKILQQNALIAREHFHFASCATGSIPTARKRRCGRF